MTASTAGRGGGEWRGTAGMGGREAVARRDGRAVWARRVGLKGWVGPPGGVWERAGGLPLVQRLVGVNAGAVPVTPFYLKSVTSYERD